MEVEKLDAVAHFVDGIKRELVKNTTLQTQGAQQLSAALPRQPDLAHAVTTAVSDALDSHTSLSLQSLGSKEQLKALLEMLSSPIYEELQSQASTSWLLTS